MPKMNMIRLPPRLMPKAPGLVGWLEQTRVQLPLKGVEFDFSVQGGFVEVEVRQVFHQDNAKPLNCTYLFPLPAEAVVYLCEIHLNDRLLTARVEERTRAVELARKQQQAGHHTALIESERDNLFTLTLGNVQPQDLVVVRLAYVQPVSRLGTRCSLEIPNCPGIRYIPGQPLLRSNRGGGPADDTDQVPDASRITTPRIDALHPDAAYLSVAGWIEARCVDFASLSSPSHNTASRQEKDRITVQLNNGHAVPDSNFVLRWQEQVEKPTQPQGWVCHRDGYQYAWLEVRAPENSSEGSPPPKDIYLLVDRSGSMKGVKWEKAIQLAQELVKNLGPQDRVWITLFETEHQDFAELPLERDTLLSDPQFLGLSRLGTQGGTELGPALRHILEMVQRHSAGKMNHIVLITDAEVGNEEDILKIAFGAPDVPIHCFGLDTAVNDALLLALSKQQQGSCQCLHPNDDIVRIAAELGPKLGRTAFTDLRLSAGWELAEARIPNVYAGQICYLAVRSSDQQTPVELMGQGADGFVQLTFEPRFVSGMGPYLMWVRRRLSKLLTERQSEEAVRLSCEANVLCRLTAFIAWDTVEQAAVAPDNLIQPGFEPMASEAFAPNTVDRYILLSHGSVHACRAPGPTSKDNAPSTRPDPIQSNLDNLTPSLNDLYYKLEVWAMAPAGDGEMLRRRDKWRRFCDRFCGCREEFERTQSAIELLAEDTDNFLRKDINKIGWRMMNYEIRQRTRLQQAPDEALKTSLEMVEQFHLEIARIKSKAALNLGILQELTMRRNNIFTTMNKMLRHFADEIGFTF